MANRRVVGNLTVASGDFIDHAASYTVTVYPVGATAAASATGSGGTTTVTVDAGHDFAVNDYLMVGSDTAKFARCTASAATSLTFNAELSISAGDVLVNLGPNDTGTTSPNFDGSDVNIYSDMDLGTLVTESRLTADAQGNYAYWTTEPFAWELVRDTAGTPQRIIQRGEQATTLTQTYATADATHAALTAADFTDNSGGTPTTTIAAITGGGAGCEDATKNAIASLADQHDKLLVDLTDLKQFVNSLVDELQAQGKVK